VQNVGTAPTTITNVEFLDATALWKRILQRLRLKKRRKEKHAILNDYRGPGFHLKLEVGGDCRRDGSTHGSERASFTAR